MVSGQVYGFSSNPTDLETARQCCTAYGPYFRLAVFDDVTPADVITVELRGLVGTSKSFWVDAIRAGYNTSENFTWSSGQPVSESQWAAVNRGAQDVACHLEMDYTVPRLTGDVQPATNYSVLCQEFDPPDQTQLLTESTTFTVSEPATVESLPASSIESLVAATSTNPDDEISSGSTIKTTDSSELVFEASQTDSSLTSLLLLDPTPTISPSGAGSMALRATTLIPQTSIFSHNDVNTGDVSASTHTLTTLEQSTNIAPSFDSISSSEIPSVFGDMSTPSFEPSETETYSTTAPSTNENITNRIIHTCCCTLPPSQSVTQAEPDVQEKINSIQENLAVNKSILSRTIRKKTSATDDRLTACVIGGVGLACLLLSIMLVIILDMRVLFSIRPGIRIRQL
ncbi:hypothetical protein V1264_003312 [Littorina saxatilis]|uniref:C-type lectin domain-containing protein n=1 Tax=Littorina saxatilis TaxID=31220 RepID=A0AAN9G9S9_9CAEN